VLDLQDERVPFYRHADWNFGSLSVERGWRWDLCQGCAIAGYDLRAPILGLKLGAGWELEMKPQSFGARFGAELVEQLDTPRYRRYKKIGVASFFYFSKEDVL
jgi:hypothetical protein